MTLMWHVDDIKVSHKNTYQITKFSSYLSSMYGDKLTVKQGNVHEYIGMYLYCSEGVSVKVSMIKYTGKILRTLPENIVGSAVSPAAEHLFKVRYEK